MERPPTFDEQKYGFIPPVKVPEDYTFGAANELGGIPLVPDGQWDSFLPVDEVQNLNEIEPYACVSFTINNCAEILQKQEFEQVENYSDKFLAAASGTGTRLGNDPKTVGQTFRDNGCPKEYEYPFDSTVTTFDKFYTVIPQAIYRLALLFKDRFDFGYEWVGADQQSMMAALPYSPLGVAVHAWTMDADGFYIRPKGAISTHFTVIYGYKRNEYWKCFDSYSNTHKKLRWDFGFEFAQRYTLHARASNPDMWTWFLAKLKAILGL